MIREVGTDPQPPRLHPHPHPHPHSHPHLQKQDESVVKKLAERMPDMGKKMDYLLNTGVCVRACV